MIGDKKIDVNNVYVVAVGTVCNKKYINFSEYTYDLKFLKYSLVKPCKKDYIKCYKDIITNEIYLGSLLNNGSLDIFEESFISLRNILIENNITVTKMKKSELITIIDTFNQKRNNETININIEKNKLKEMLIELKTIITTEQITKIKEIIEKSDNESIKKVLELK